MYASRVTALPINLDAHPATNGRGTFSGSILALVNAPFAVLNLSTSSRVKIIIAPSGMSLAWSYRIPCRLAKALNLLDSCLGATGGTIKMP